MFPDNVKVYVLHVDEAKYYNRKLHILKEMKKHKIPFTWVTDGSICQMTPEIYEKLFLKFFAGYKTSSCFAAASCAYKHYLAWNKFLETDYEYCLILEDDVFLSTNFTKYFVGSIQEMEKEKDKYDNKISIQYSNAANLYTPKEILKTGKHLYKNKECRATDAYLITRSD